MSQVQCVVMESRGVPQSAQSEPRGQASYAEPAPPSSQVPSFAYEHALEHAWPETVARCKSMSVEAARIILVLGAIGFFDEGIPEIARRNRSRAALARQATHDYE